MAFIHLGQKRHTVSELASRYKKASTGKTKLKIKECANMYLSPEDLDKFIKKTL